jgi:DNA-binding XRE family transcriptional regulator
MDGKDILRVRQGAGVSQTELSKALGLVQRGTLTDIESGAVEVSTAWALKAIGAVSGIAASRRMQE